ncbi:MAG: tetratricopeptide repeat protein [Planctomycetota bacterium]
MTLRPIHYLTCFWPGLPEIWFRGSLAALPFAIIFTFGVNLILWTQFVYVGLLPEPLDRVVFWLAAIFWLIAAIRSAGRLSRIVPPTSTSKEPDKYPEALGAYLRGQWTQAERILTTILAIEARDPPALLLLTSIYRQTDRLEAAEILLDEVERLEAAIPWATEISIERNQIQAADLAASDHDQQEAA